MYWPTLVPVIQNILNHSPKASLSSYTPAQAFGGFETTTSLDQVFRPDIAEWLILPKISKSVEVAHDRLVQSLETIHKEISVKSAAQHERNLSSQRGNKVVNFEIGDYVLWSAVDRRLPKGKLECTWKGPFRIIATISDQVYQLEHLVADEVLAAHATRMKYYCDSSLEVTEELKQHINSQQSYSEVEKFISIKREHAESRGPWKVEVAWLGYSDNENSLESIEDMWHDVPIMMMQFLVEDEKQNPTIVAAVLQKHHDAMASEEVQRPNAEFQQLLRKHLEVRGTKKTIRTAKQT